MIQIIEAGTKQITKCNICGCKFSYEEEDIVSGINNNRIMNHGLYKYIECPQCKERVVLEQSKQLGIKYE